MKSLLKVTTDYSLLNSMIKVEDLINYCKDNNITTCGLCDNNLFGVMNFYNKCLDNNIKPLIGLDINFLNNHIYLYAKNYDGYKNLLKINTIIQTRDIALLDLELNSSNVIAVIPFKYREIYNEIKNVYKKVYISYTNEYEKNNALLISDNVIFLNDIKALDNKDASYINYLNMIEKNTTINDYQIIDYSNNVVLETEDEFDINTINSFILEFDIKIPKGENYIPKYECDNDNDDAIIY